MLISGLVASAGHGACMFVLGGGWGLGQEAGDDSRLTLFVGIAAFSMLLQVLILVGVGIGSLVALKKVMAEIDEIKAKINPMIAKGNELASKASTLATDLTPTIKNIVAKADVITGKVETIAGHGVEISETVKQKVDEFGPTISKANETLLSANQTVMDATTKTHEQLLRVNEMISQTLDATEKAGKRVVHNVTQPGREIAGLATGLKVAVKTFFDQKSRPAAGSAASSFASEAQVHHSTTVAEALARDESDDIGL